jgi:hypothetical protein
MKEPRGWAKHNIQKLKEYLEENAVTKDNLEKYLENLSVS